VVLDLLNGNLPAKHRVALRAVRTELSAVNIRMAIRAVLSDVRENRLYMALGAFHLFVHASKRVTRLVVIEFRDRSNRPPARRGMAVFTGNRQGTVRAPRGLPLRHR